MPLSGETAAEAAAKRDGLLIEDETTNQSAEIMCSNELPTVRLIGSKVTTTDQNTGFTEPTCPVIEIADSAGTIT